MNFVVALQAEACPLIDHYGLKRSSGSPFRTFENQNHRLVISGIGTIRCAAATGYLLGLLPSRNEGLVNLGIAGHGQLQKGSLFIANRVSLDSPKKSLYPPQLLKTSLPTSGLRTSDRPEEQYPEPIGYDMEAYAFCSIAHQWLTREFVQVLKIVSDTPVEPLVNFNAKEAQTLVENQVPAIDEFVHLLQSMVSELAVPSELASLSQKTRSLHHFTATQSLQLEKLFMHARSLALPMEEMEALLNRSSNAREIIHALDQKLSPLRSLS